MHLHVSLRLKFPATAENLTGDALAAGVKVAHVPLHRIFRSERRKTVTGLTGEPLSVVFTVHVSCKVCISSERQIAATPLADVPGSVYGALVHLHARA